MKKIAGSVINEVRTAVTATGEVHKMDEWKHEWYWEKKIMGFNN